MDLVMMIYGEFNVFRPLHIKDILQRAWHSLAPGGLLLLEPHPFQVIRQLGEAPASWYSSSGGLFSDKPHFVLHENFWDARTNTATRRYFVIDAILAQVTPYAQTMQAYQDAEYLDLITSVGFSEVQILPGLPSDRPDPGLIAIVAHK
jgi:hypothetical protein